MDTDPQLAHATDLVTVPAIEPRAHRCARYVVEVELRTWTTGQRTDLLPVVLLHGGPGLPDYLELVASMIDDLTVVHRYDQRGVGGSSWDGHHTVDLHLQDLDELIDGWGYDQVTLVGHSYGTDLAVRYCLRQPTRIGALVLLAGPFLDPWREAEHTARMQRMSSLQQTRLTELDAVENRTELQEQEMLTLAWFPDHHDQARAWGWAQAATLTRRPVNWDMNAQISIDRRLWPLEDRVEDLKAVAPEVTVVIGGAGDPRPADALDRLGRQLGRPAVIIPDAGHEPWLEQPDVFRRELRSAVARGVRSSGRAHQR